LGILPLKARNNWISWKFGGNGPLATPMPNTKVFSLKHMR